MLDLKIKHAFVVDGTGDPGFFGEIGIRDGKIVEIARERRLSEPAKRDLDAGGQVVAPGFIDVHTHYDAQLSWDKTASPSPLHGVTTVIGGNCGFTVAPMSDSESDFLLHLLSRVEGIPAEALSAGTSWHTKSFGEWIDGFEGCVGPNVGFLVGHSTIRRLVMGEAASEGAATDAHIDQMCALLELCLQGGAMGFSSSHSPTHFDGAGNPVPSRFASQKELIQLAATTGRFPGTQLEFIPAAGRFEVEHMDLMAALSRAADRPLNWNTLRVLSDDRAYLEHQLESYDVAAKQGGCVFGLTFPDVTKRRYFFSTGVGLSRIPEWADVVSLPTAERVAALRRGEVRDAMRVGARNVAADDPFIGVAQYEHFIFAETFSARNAPLHGRTVADVARERRLDALDVLLDAVLADDLRTGLDLPPLADDDASWELRATLVRDHRTIVGASDAGAHLDMMCGSVYTTALLAKLVRERTLLSLEEAVHSITARPASLYGLRGRGIVREGFAADLVVFDPESVGPHDIETVNDLPGRAARQYASADGIQRVLVNGDELVADGELTTSRSGDVLKPRRGVRTVTVSEGRRLAMASGRHV